MKSFMLCATSLLLLQSAVTLAFSEEEETALEEADDLNNVVGAGGEGLGRGYGGFTRSRRGWSMMRLGRGLQMLRLGKRTTHLPSSSSSHSSSSSSSSSSPSSPQKMRELLGALLEQQRSRHEFRRQPPMPRYGRELVQDDEEDEGLEELYDLLLAGDKKPQARHASFPPYNTHPVSRVQRSATFGSSRSGQEDSSGSFFHDHHAREGFPSSSS